MLGCGLWLGLVQPSLGCVAYGSVGLMAYGLPVRRVGGLLWRGPIASCNGSREGCQDRIGYCMPDKYLLGLWVIVRCVRAGVSALALVVVLRG